ncbi:hypothetical protein DERF_004342 [Dermatophagoides farinae]|uniref:Uncharacterized protein n=1 Tax=Dermatophagoides farinae TaxID=6954 RepID=A0A922I188_DERFA|nr:hypothetical protein DERF_004342 [Dermatophagoides farinae]
MFRPRGINRVAYVHFQQQQQQKNDSILMMMTVSPLTFIGAGIQFDCCLITELSYDINNQNR